MLGFNAHLPTTTVLKRIKEIGFDWVRIDLNWDWIEREKGQRDYEIVDQIVMDCRQLDLKILGIIGYTPNWARPSGTLRSYPPEDTTAWMRFTRDTAKRYAHNIHHWTIWNEPNVREYQDSDLGHYVRTIFKPGRDGIRLGNPNALIVAPDISVSQSNWIEWIEVFRGLQSSYDVFAVHCYGETGNKVAKYTEHGRWPSYLRWLQWLLDRWYPTKQSVRKALRGIDKPIWLTETGWATDIVSEDDQFLSYKEMIKYLDGNPLYENTFFYEIKDDRTAHRFGVLRPDLSRKLAYDYLRSIQ